MIVTVVVLAALLQAQVREPLFTNDLWGAIKAIGILVTPLALLGTIIVKLLTGAMAKRVEKLEGVSGEVPALKVRVDQYQIEQIEVRGDLKGLDHMVAEVRTQNAEMAKKVDGLKDNMQHDRTVLEGRLARVDEKLEFLVQQARDASRGGHFHRRGDDAE